MFFQTLVFWWAVAMLFMKKFAEPSLKRAADGHLEIDLRYDSRTRSWC